MSLTSGTRLGPYEIVEPIGAGGMGEVYRAQDTRLDRPVAVKVLSEVMAGDPDFRLRFEREAKAISQLTHPHICVLHDVGQVETAGRGVMSYLVMELLEGQTLAARIEKGPLPLDQALRHAADIAGALDRAHRLGIIHRDLKPANVMLTKTGAKLLDFGLAKPQMQPTGAIETHLSAQPLTAQGSILGTFQYMAPEQLEGREADARSDIWAFGCVLYEMLTGRRAFEGASQASLIGAILNHEPPAISSLQVMSPPALDRVVRTCLAKDPDDRWQNAHDLANELKWIAESHTKAVMTRRTPSWHLGAAAAAGLVLGLAAASVWWTQTRSPETPVRVRALIPLATGQALFMSQRTPVALSPDGLLLAYTALANGTPQIHVRSIDRMDVTVLGGTSGGGGPFFSPDSKWVGFFSAAEGRLKKVALSGGAAVTICEAPDVRGASWGLDDQIVYTGQLDGGLMRVAAGGGAGPEPLTQPDAGRREKTHRFPHVLPNGKGVLFTIGTHDITSFDDAAIAVYDAATKQSRVLIDGGSDARYLAPGYVLYARAGGLMAVPFDQERLEVTGTPVSVLDGLLTSASFGWAAFGASDNGVMAHVQGAEPSEVNQLTWVDSSGTLEPVGDRRYLLGGRLSPSGEQVAVRVSGANDTLWVHDFRREGSFSRLTFRGNVTGAVWTPDGRRIVYNIGNEIASIAADGSGDDKTLLKDDFTGVPTSVTPDGKTVLYYTNRPGTGWDIHALDIDTGKTRPVLSAPFAERFARLSPDGRWIAYTSNESGRDEVYVRPFPALGRRTQISREGGSHPVWATTGTELYFRDGPDILAVPVRTTASDFDNGIPQKRAAPAPRAGLDAFDVGPDGRLFVTQSTPPQLPSAVHLVVGWLDELRSRVVPAR
ncbi:hypothetical protein BH24ACI5_BH24ACI5_28430 [soil metagenome]